jgi:hypothetical protein
VQCTHFSTVLPALTWKCSRPVQEILPHHFLSLPYGCHLV